MTDISRVPNRKLPSKSSVAIYRLPGGGGFLWAVATSPDRTQDIRAQTLGALGVIDGYLRDAGLDRTRIVKAEIVVTDHDNKPAFCERRLNPVSAVEDLHQVRTFGLLLAAGRPADVRRAAIDSRCAAYRVRSKLSRLQGLPQGAGPRNWISEGQRKQRPP